MVKLEKDDWKYLRCLCQKILNHRFTVMGRLKCTEALLAGLNVQA